MARVNNVMTIPKPVAADYSSTGQFRFVGQNASGQAITVSVAGAKAIGILMNAPSGAGRAGEIAIGGQAKVIASAAIAVDADVASTDDGRAVTAVAGNVVLARALEPATAAGQVISVLLISQHTVPTP